MLFLLFFSPFIIFFIIALILEIDITKGPESGRNRIHQKIFKHFPGFIILLFYFLYAFAWGEYHVGHYHTTTVKEFRLFPSMDGGSNFIATLAIFYFLYSGLFVLLNEYWFKRKLKDK